MTTGEYSPLLRNGSSRSSATQHHLPINANYYDITDIDSWPVAGLLVLLDGQAQPVRAELHLYDDLDEHTQEAAIRQARLVLQERYLGGVPVPVRILETMQAREEMLVRLPPLGARPITVQSLALRWRPHGMIGAAILALVALIWIVTSLLGSGQGDGENATLAGTPESASQTNEGGVGSVPTVAEGEATAESAPAAVAPVDGGNLPVSRNARGDLGIGMRVQAVPGLRLALRSEPGADRGIVVGEMAEGVVATIVGGPEFTQGDADTIVWWYVDLPNSTQAWAAANTSQQTLLMPAP
jgi:hypothetical protein